MTVVCLGCQPATEEKVAPPVPVTIAKSIERQVQEYEEMTGRISAPSSVEIRARVTGYLEKPRFKDGDEVKQGDVLFVIDPRPFQAVYDSAIAQIALNKANMAFRNAELARNKELVEKGAVSRSEFDKAAASFEESKAMVAVAEANAEAAKLNLGFTEIHSPIDGQISLANITEGNLVVADQTLLTSIVSVDPMHVKFDVDERRLLRIRKQAREGAVKLNDEIVIPVEMALDNDINFPHRGTIDFVDNQLDKSTGTMQIRGVFPNPLPAKGKRILVPGMFARVRVPMGEPHQAVLIAEQALGSDQGQKYVFVVDSKNEVQYRRVTTGKVEAGLRVVLSGLTPGEQVIVGGLQRVRPGSAVQAKVVDMNSFAVESPAPQTPATPPKIQTTGATPPAQANTPASGTTEQAAPVDPEPKTNISTDNKAESSPETPVSPATTNGAPAAK